MRRAPHEGQNPRVYDDTGKRAGVPTKTFADNAPMVQRVVVAQGGAI